MIKKLGVQLYTIKPFMQTEDDIKKSFEKIKKLGYDIAQTAGFPVIPYEDFAKYAKDAGIKIIGTHEAFDHHFEKTEQSMENHKILGTNNMGIGGFFPGENLAAWKTFIEKATALAEKIKPHGYNFTYHNHSHEFIRLEDGRFVMEHLIDAFSKYDNMTFCLDTYWLQHGGVNVLEWMDKMSGKVNIFHLKDYKRFFEGPDICEIGAGSMNWEDIIKKAEEIGVKYYVVEQDRCPGNPFDSLKMSSDYIHANFM